jgi:hypothetical protein
LAVAERANIGYLRSYLQMPLALAQAKLGDASAAIGSANAAIQSLTALGSRGLNLAAAYEARTRVAIYLNDSEGFEHFTRLCAEQLRVGASRVLTARYERLRQEAKRAQVDASAPLPEIDAFTEPLTASALTSFLEGCRGFSQRSQSALALLLKHSGSTAGFLYTLGEHGPELAAEIAEHDAPADLVTNVREYLDGELKSQEECTAILAQRPALGPEAMHDSSGEHYRFVLLSHAGATGFLITGVAVLAIEADRQFVYPGPMATHLSRILLDCGDVVAAAVSS